MGRVRKKLNAVEGVEDDVCANEFGRSELALLNLIAEIIVEIVMQDEDD